jgi:hypothetical protein
MEDLPAIQEGPESSNGMWPRDLVCQVAFVSPKSKLVTTLVQEEKHNRPKDNLHTADLNGKLLHNNWLLIWSKRDDTDTMTEADYMMPKIVPGNFFGGNVTKAFYVEPTLVYSLPSLQIMWYLMAKQLDAKKQKGRTTRVTRSGTSVGELVELPVVPARHVALFTHSFGLPEPLSSEISMDAVAKFVLAQKGQGSERSLWPRRQMQFYDNALERSRVQLVDTFILIHNLESDRSRRLRCEWYEEQLFWSNDQDGRNRDLEDLSLAFVLARWRTENRLVPAVDDDDIWGERIVDLSKGDKVEIIETATESPPSQYFVRLHKPMKARRQYP